jgi:hypothetical protein
MRKQLYWLSDAELKRLEPLLRGVGVTPIGWTIAA